MYLRKTVAIPKLTDRLPGMPMIKNILITGLPHCGKSTLLRNLVSEMSEAVGFYTQELLKDGERIGFQVAASDGQSLTFAQRGVRTDFPVGPYGVNIPEFEQFLSGFQSPKKGVIYLDEIGQMQLYSEQFKTHVTELLDSPALLIATISCVYKSPFIDAVIARPDTMLFHITPENRNQKLAEIRAILS